MTAPGDKHDMLWNRARTYAESPFVPWDDLEGARVLITGSTGLIGSQLTRTLLARNEARGTGMQLVLPVRDPDKARSLFGERDDLELVTWWLGYSLDACGKVDYLVHAASPTSSEDFRYRPVEVVEQILAGARAVLEHAYREDAKRTLFLSTMEVYGEIQDRITEDRFGSLDPMDPRSSYPEAKRLTETLLAAYAAEYNVAASVLRLAQTFGEGVAYDDGRVFAEFARCADGGQDIVLLSDGSKKNPYLSVGDAVQAILVVLLKGKAGLAYNAANEETYCSIRDMAEAVLAELGRPDAQLRFEVDEERAATFRKASDLQMDTSRLRALGWEARESLMDAYQAMVEAWKEQGR